MPFQTTPVVTSLGRNTDHVNVPTSALTARAGAPSAAATDTGVLTTAAPAVNENGLSQNLGPGRGNWTQADVDGTIVQIEDDQDAADHVAAYVFSKALVGGNLVITVHNRDGTNALDVLNILVRAPHSLPN